MRAPRIEMTWLPASLEGTRGRVGDRRADAAADDDDRAEVLDLRGLAERADDVEDRVAGARAC